MRSVFVPDIQLAGLPVIRAFNQQSVFQHRLQKSINNENVSAPTVSVRY